MRAEGTNGVVVLTKDCLKISHKGLANVLTAGNHGESSTPLSSVTAVQFKSAGAWMCGYIQFSVLGRATRPSGIAEATKDQNAVLFNKKQEASFQSLKNSVERRCAELRMPQVNQSSGIDELEKLASLVERGFLTREDFDAKKKEILGAL